MVEVMENDDSSQEEKRKPLSRNTSMTVVPGLTENLSERKPRRRLVLTVGMFASSFNQTPRDTKKFTNGSSDLTRN